MEVPAITIYSPTPVSLPELFAPAVPKTFLDPATMMPYSEGAFVSVSKLAERVSTVTADAVRRHAQREAGGLSKEVAVAVWWRRDLGQWMVDACAYFDEAEDAVELGRSLGLFEIDVLKDDLHQCLAI